jgi:hypothetical protein
VASAEEGMNGIPKCFWLWPHQETRRPIPHDPQSRHEVSRGRPYDDDGRQCATRIGASTRMTDHKRRTFARRPLRAQAWPDDFDPECARGRRQASCTSGCRRGTSCGRVKSQAECDGDGPRATAPMLRQSGAGELRPAEDAESAKT